MELSMSIIRNFTSKEEFLGFRDHVASVLAEKSIVFKPRKLDELVAKIVGTPDFNTALGLCSEGNSAVEPRMLIETKITAHLGGVNQGLQAISAKFDSSSFFEQLLKEGSLFPHLFLMQMKPFSFCSAVVKFMRERDPKVERIASEIDSGEGLLNLSISSDDAALWLSNHGQGILASWVRYKGGIACSDYIKSFREFTERHSKLCYHRGSAADINAFLKGFRGSLHIEEVSPMAQGDSRIRFKCSSIRYKRFFESGSHQLNSFETKLDAIYHFLDAFDWDGGVHAAPAIEKAQGSTPKKVNEPIDPRLTHFIVCDANGSWGRGETLQEARQNKEFYKNEKLTPSTFVHRCTAKTRYNENGSLVWPNSDPVPVRIDHKTGLRRA
jgi:hypothetical protein